ncbi:MAG: putative subtilase-type serine protease precursor [Verrucomicrobiales bacterium]|nr:putative subtilase-type serine protease precursor [Verrucomicrobiales bacterium]
MNCMREAAGILFFILPGLWGGSAFCQENGAAGSGPAPAVTAIEPAAVTPGFSGLLKIRGFKLADATAITFTGPEGVKAEIGERGVAAPVAGFELKEAGETRLEARLSVSADAVPGRRTFVITTPAGEVRECHLEILSAEAGVAEKEPNDGFHEAQSVRPGQTVWGGIGKEKDVDVYRIEGGGKGKIILEILGARLPSLLDAGLLLTDSSGALVAMEDDGPDTRDPRIIIPPGQKGPLFLSVYDVNDHGGPWHGYQLIIREEQ